MTSKTTIRATTQDELGDILALYPLAFPDEDLTGLIEALLSGEPGVTSLGAYQKGALVGHILFTRDFSGKGALLAPLGVAPEVQLQGIGTALIAAGLEAMKAQGMDQVFVLGDPKYYSRAGFSVERDVQPCCPIPEQWSDAWQSLAFGEAELPAGPLGLPAPWMDPALWS